MPFALPTVTPDEKERMLNKYYVEPDEYEYKFASQTVVFAEDDRKERPLIIIQLCKQRIHKIWFAIFDFASNKLIKSSSINITPLEVNHIHQMDDIQLSPSSGIEAIHNKETTTHYL